MTDNLENNPNQSADSNEPEVDSPLTDWIKSDEFSFKDPVAEQPSDKADPDKEKAELLSAVESSLEGNSQLMTDSEKGDDQASQSEVKKSINSLLDQYPDLARELNERVISDPEKFQEWSLHAYIYGRFQRGKGLTPEEHLRPNFSEAEYALDQSYKSTAGMREFWLGQAIAEYIVTGTQTAYKDSITPIQMFFGCDRAKAVTILDRLVRYFEKLRFNR